jgi:hypothetical protein
MNAVVCFPVVVAERNSPWQCLLFFDSHPHVSDLSQALCISLGFAHPQAIRVFTTGFSQLSPDQLVNIEDRYFYDYPADSVAVTFTVPSIRQFCVHFSRTQTVQNMKEFLLRHCVLWFPDRLVFTSSNRALSDSETVRFDTQLSITVQIRTEHCRQIECFLSFAGFPGVNHRFLAFLQNSDVIGDVGAWFASLLKLPFYLVRVCGSDGKLFASDVAISSLAMKGLRIRVLSAAVFFRLRLPSRLERVKLFPNPPTVSQARVRLSETFALDDAVGLIFRVRSSPIPENANLTWYETTESAPIECEILYETWFATHSRPISWVHGSDATIKDAISELSRRYFSVNSLRDPENPAVRLDSNAKLVSVKGKVLSIEFRKMLVFVTRGGKTREYDAPPGQTLAAVFSNPQVSALFFDDYSTLTPEDPCDGLRGRFFVLSADEFLPMQIELPDQTIWRGDVPAFLKVNSLAAWIADSGCSFPNLGLTRWSLMAGHAIVDEERLVCSLVLAKKP